MSFGGRDRRDNHELDKGDSLSTTAWVVLPGTDMVITDTNIRE